MQQENEKFHGLLCYIITHRVNIVFAGRKLIKFLQFRWQPQLRTLDQCLRAEVGGLNSTLCAQNRMEQKSSLSTK